MKKLSKFAVILLAVAFVLFSMTGCPDPSTGTASDSTNGNSETADTTGTASDSTNGCQRNSGHNHTCSNGDTFAQAGANSENLRRLVVAPLAPL